MIFLINSIIASALLGIVLINSHPLYADSSLKNQPIKYVIFAGGGGYRLWPLSSPERPKQFIPFLNSDSLLKQTIKRIAPVTKSPEDVMVVTLERYRDDILRDVGKLTGTIVTEPMSRNTGPALLQALKNLSESGQDPVIVVLWADHFIPNQAQFLTLLEQAVEMAIKQQSLAILGVYPTYPATGYGYIQAGDQITPGCFKVQQFHEKPNQTAAQKYLEAGNYFWNMGIVVGKVSTFIQEFKRHAPELFTTLMQAQDMHAAYEKIIPVSIDVAMLEKCKNIVVLPWAHEWYDVGNIHLFLELHERHTPQKNNQNVISVNAFNNLVSSKKIVACVGVSDLCIVETDNELLIVAQKDAELVKKVVESIEIQKTKNDVPKKY